LPALTAQGLHGFFAAQGLHALAAQGLQGFAAAHGLQGFDAATRRGTTQSFALAAESRAPGPQGLQGFAAAHGLHGLAAAHGLQGFLAAHGLHGFAGAQAAKAGLAPTTPEIAPAVMPAVTASAKGTTVVARRLALNGCIAFPPFFCRPGFGIRARVRRAGPTSGGKI